MGLVVNLDESLGLVVLLTNLERIPGDWALIWIVLGGDCLGSS